LSSSLNVTLALLAGAAGMMDALSYTRLDHVFTSAMTGNTALLGLALGELEYAAVLRSSLAFGGFVAGLAIGALLLGNGIERGRWSRGVTAALWVELVLLAAFTAAWLITTDTRSTTVLYSLIVLAAAGMGLQSVAVWQLRVPGISTTFFTGTLTSIVISSVRFVRPGQDVAQKPSNTLRQIMALVAYVVGAAIAGVAAAHQLEAVSVLPLIAVLIVLVWHIVLG